MTYFISDIHGEYDLFVKLVRHVGFCSKDELIVLGDIVDKGQDSVKLLKLIKSLPNARCILGNHELAFLKYYWSLMKDSPNDYDQVLKKLQEYFSGDGELLDWDTVDWLESLDFFIEGQNYICVHAGIPLDNEGNLLPLNKATKEQLVYDRTFKDPNVLPKGGKCVLFGHTPTSYITNKPEILTYKREGTKGSSLSDYYKIHLDCGVWLYGQLGCFCEDTCQSYYVNRKAL